MPEITLYELAPTRSARCRWALLEAGLDFESVAPGPQIIGSDELKKVHPMGKLPAAIIDGKPLFESTAITTAIADLVPEKGLVGPSGSWARALHDQWTSFALTELEAWVWSTAVNTFVLPEDQRITAHLEQNAAMFKRGAAALDGALADDEFLVENRFSATDIIMGYAVNFGRRMGLVEGFDNVEAYMQRLFEREHCTLAHD